MDYSIEELKELLPRWGFKNYNGSIEINNGFFCYFIETKFIGINIDLMKHIYDTQNDVVKFLKENGFIQKINNALGYSEFEKNNISITISIYYYLSINGIFELRESNYDRFIDKLKEILDVESRNKFVNKIEIE